MRFLLHTKPSGAALKQVERKVAEKVPVFTQTVRKETKEHFTSDDKKANDANGTDLVKAWGQQCSSQCGCVVRFETDIHSETDTITSAKYHAKTVLTRVVDGKLEPQLTARTNRPMIKECTCSTLHHLASQVASSITSEKLSSVRNMTEFDGVRSSTAFRHAVLASQQLPRTDTHCFDLVEEAFSAMIRGHMPHPRRATHKKKILVAAALPQERQPQEYEETTGAASAAVSSSIGYGVDRNSMSMASAHAMSALYLMDVDQETANGTPLNTSEHNELHEDEEVSNAGITPVMDWVAYVDEMYRREADQESSAYLEILS